MRKSAIKLYPVPIALKDQPIKVLDESSVFIYVGNPMDGYIRKNNTRKYSLHLPPKHISWQMLQDIIKMKQYIIEFVSSEEYFLECV